MSPFRDRHFLAIGSDVRLILAGFGLFLAVGLVSGIGVGVLSSRQLAQAPDVKGVAQTASREGDASLGEGVQEAWDRLRQIAQLDWMAVVEPRTAENPARTAAPAGRSEKAEPQVASVSLAEAARRVAEVRQFSPHKTALRTDSERTVDAMLRRFEQQGFDFADLRSVNSSDMEVPRIFLARLPVDIAEVDITEKRKRAFIKVMLPHVLRENERIMADRERLLDLREREQFGGNVSLRDRRWLQQLASNYGLDGIDMEELLNRVDVVPPALALAQSIEESGWGTSRFALLGNAVFGQWTWTPGAGIVPENRPEGETYEVKSFRSLENSVSAYMRNLNTKGAYREFRNKRAGMRESGDGIDGYQLAGQLQRYSERGADYIRTIRLLIRSNNLEAFDAARLTDEPAPLLGSLDFFGKS